MASVEVAVGTAALVTQNLARLVADRPLDLRHLVLIGVVCRGYGIGEGQTSRFGITRIEACGGAVLMLDGLQCIVRVGLQQRVLGEVVVAVKLRYGTARLQDHAVLLHTYRLLLVAALGRDGLVDALEARAADLARACHGGVRGALVDGDGLDVGHVDLCVCRGCGRQYGGKGDQSRFHGNDILF